MASTQKGDYFSQEFEVRVSRTKDGIRVSIIRSYSSNYRDDEVFSRKYDLEDLPIEL